MESACHKRIIFNSIAEYYQLGCSNALSVFGQFGCLSNFFTHESDCVHVDTGFGGTDIDRGAYQFRFCKGAGNGLNQLSVAGAETFLYQSGKTADEVYAYLVGNFVQGFCVFYRVAAGNADQHGNRCHGDSLVYDGNAVLLFDEFAGLYKVFGKTENFVIDLFTGFFDIAVSAVD